MDIVSRLILVLLLALPWPAFSDSCPASYSGYMVGFASKGYPITGIEGLTLVCQSYGSNWQAEGGASFTQSGSVYSSWCGAWESGVWKRKSGNQVKIGSVKEYRDDSGASFSTDPGTCAACQPNQERDPDTGICECKTILNAGSFMVSGDVYQGCNSGCGMVLRSGWYDKTANTTWGSWDQNGMACTAGEPSVLSANDPKVEAAKQCASGTCPGTFNGDSICVPCDKTKQTDIGTKSETSSTTASGASSAGPASTSTESNSSRTECSNGSCTTTETTTVTGPNGDKTDTSKTTTEPQSDYCTRNPRAEVCKGTESSWGGSCGSFSCDGDAVTCAIAQASWKSACAVDIWVFRPIVTVDSGGS